jgi:quercetin dioxygenase-like cupin family protein
VILTARSPRAARVAAVVLGSGLLIVVGGCARPGQLGQAAPAPAAVAAPVPAPPPPAPPEPVAPVELGTGTVDSRVSIRTSGPSEYSVRTVVMEPGESMGWQRHPGTEMTIVRSGAVTLVRQGACSPARFTAGDALHVGDAVPHRLTNDGAGPAELVVTELLTPGEPESTEVEAACPPR